MTSPSQRIEVITDAEGTAKLTDTQDISGCLGQRRVSCCLMDANLLLPDSERLGNRVRRS
jgi:hypothetical protein